MTRVRGDSGRLGNMDAPIDWDRVPIFPLPECVLFPRTLLPLHVFEPRYRAMTQDCIERNLPIAICMARPGEDLAGAPEVLGVAGVGVLERHERLDDGRYHIVLRGVARMRIEDEIPHRPYRMVRGTPLEDRWPQEGAAVIEPAAATLRRCVERVAGLAIETHIAAEVLRRLGTAVDAAHLADIVAGMFVGDAFERQALLEELEVETRLHRVTGVLAELLLRAEAARRGGNDPVQ